MNKRYIVYKAPISSPGDYYGVQSNTIEDIVGIFKTRNSALEFCEKQNLQSVHICKIYWEE